MLTITIPKGEFYDQEKGIFYNVDKETIIQLEHSLISLQKWEAKWQKPFLVKDKKTFEETIDYIRCMCLTTNVKDDVFYCIPEKEIEKISAYIDSPMTATTFREDKLKGNGRKISREIPTAEILYYLMISYNIPSEYRKWHLNQLLTLIRVFNIKNQPQKKRTKREIMEEFHSINEENKRRFNTKG